ncbi:MAG: LysR substrate-binding domain-containing protein [Pseudodesulfovibrio sp.]
MKKIDDEVGMQFSNDLLKTFTAVADSGNFTRAGEFVNRTQSAVSMQIKRLESEVGHVLFDRNGGMRSITLTPKGEELLRYARRILMLHDEAVAAVGRPGIEGKVRLGLPEDYSSTFLPQVLARFGKTNPNAQVDIICAPGAQVSALLGSGKLDLGIRTGVDPLDGAELLRREPLSWITSPSSMVHKRTQVPLAVYWEGCCYRKWAMKALESVERDYHVAFTSLSISGILAAVYAGLAVGVVGSTMVPKDIQVLDESDGYPALPTASVTLHRGAGPQNDLMESITEHIRDAFQEM